MSISILLSGIIGPVLIVMAITEYRNFDIWKNVHPTLVYLNGLVLLILGLIAIRFHNIWVWDWRLIITIIAWLVLLIGLVRMVFPKARQLENSTASIIVFIVMLTLGTFLSIKAYFL